ncbi:hypothetical protein ACLK1S_09135 [Escherichia coli]
MIAIGGAIGTDYFFRCRSPTANGGSSIGTGLFNLWLVFVFILRALGELVLHRPSSGSFVSYAREFWVRKPLMLLAGCTHQLGDDGDC